jgi:hypothetical protein
MKSWLAVPGGDVRNRGLLRPDAIRVAVTVGGLLSTARLIPGIPMAIAVSFMESPNPALSGRYIGVR